MPFHRFENFESKFPTPHLSTGKAPVIEAMSIDEVNRVHATGKWAGKEKEPEKSRAIIDGLGECYYPILEFLDAPSSSGNRPVRYAVVRTMPFLEAAIDDRAKAETATA